jgi:arginase
MLPPPSHKSHKIRILGVPMDLGQSRRGVDMGPSAVRYAGLQDRLIRLGYQVEDCGNVPVPVVEEIKQEDRSPDEIEQNARHLGAVVEVCQGIYERAVNCVQEGEIAVFLGGDHSISVGSVSGVASQRRVGVIWVDAHADYNTPKTSPSGNVHGMPVAALLGDGPEPLVNIGYPGPKLHPSQVAMIGIRNLDFEERQRLIKSGISVFTMTDIDEHGIAQITRQALYRLNHLDYIHVSLDMDSLDPDIAPGVGTPIPGGLTYREAHLLMEILAGSGKVNSMDIVEINPILDTRNQTAEMAVELAASLFGQRIV